MAVVLERAYARHGVVVAPQLEDVVLIFHVPQNDLFVDRAAHEEVLLVFLRDVQPRELEPRKLLRVRAFYLGDVQVVRDKFKRLQGNDRSDVRKRKLPHVALIARDQLVCVEFPQAHRAVGASCRDFVVVYGYHAVYLLNVLC